MRMVERLLARWEVNIKNPELSVLEYDAMMRFFGHGDLGAGDCARGKDDEGGKAGCIHGTR